ncbi:unnamed protein product [Cunninghamella blakesleeana]
MIYHCDYKDVWEKGDFTPCFHQVIINGALPFIVLAGSFILLLTKLLKIQHCHKNELLYSPINNKNTSYGTVNADHANNNSDDLASSSSSSSTLRNSNSMIGHLGYDISDNSSWPQFTFIRLIISILQSIFCTYILYQIYNDHYQLDTKIEGTFTIDILLDYKIRLLYWIYSIISLIFAGFYGNVFFSLNVVNHLNLICVLDFVLRLFDIHSFYIFHDIDIMASKGYLFTVIYTGLTFILLIAIINEYPISRPKKPIISASGRVVSGENWASYYSQFLFAWVDVMMQKGWKQQLNDDDLLELPAENISVNVLATYKHNYRWNMALSILQIFKGPLAIQFFYCMIWSIGMFGPPYFLSKTIKYIEDGSSSQVPVSTAYLFVFGLLVTTIGQSLAYQQSLYIGRTLGIRVQSIVIGEVYDKALRRRDDSGAPSDASDLATKGKKGNVNNLLSVDAQKMGEVTAYCFYYYCFPIQAAICIWGLYNLLGVASLYGVLAMILLQPLTYLLGKKFQRAHQKCMTFTDKRIKLMNELLNAIRIVKFFAWEEEFKTRIIETRDQELKAIRSRLYMFMYISVTYFMIPITIMITVFFIYTRTNELTASTAFTGVALFNTFKGIFEELPVIINFTLQANVSLRRIEKFLEEEEVDQNRSTIHPTTSLGFVDDASFSWIKPKKDDHGNTTAVPHLQKLNLSFPLNRFSIICGPTGSGKSTLIASLLGETYNLSGRAILPRKPLSNRIIGGSTSGVAYVSQTPWLQNMSIRDNILFGLPYDEERYNKVLYMAALTRDLEILEYGDSTEVGEKGISLSGGQKQRLAIARAVYSQADIVILDDCLSAVDAHTAKHLYEHCLMGEYMKNRTVILVTHHVGLCIRGADYVVSLQDGQVVSAGTPTHVINSGALGEDFSLLEDIITGNEAEALEGSVPMIPLHVNTSNHKDGKGKLIKEEERVEGGVNFSVYQTYIKSSGGYAYWALILFLYSLGQGSILVQDYWIKVWASAYNTVNNNTMAKTVMMMLSFDHYSQPHASDENDDPNKSINVSYYLGMYVLLGLIASLFSMIKQYALYNGSIKASRLLHIQLLNSVLRAKVRYFDTTPLGRIVNRFSSDIETIDQSVSPALGFLLYNIIATIFVVLLISSVTPAFIFAAILISYLFWKLGNYYLRSSRDMKRLNSVSRSPIYAQFHESVNGVATIRAFGATRRFVVENFKKIDCNNRSFLWMWACNRWLHCRVDILGGLVGFCTGIVLIFSRNWIDAGLAGLSLSYSLMFTRYVLWVVRNYALNEMNCVSIERVKEYLNIESEIKDEQIHQQVPPQWPAHGKVKVDNLVIRYSPELPSVLHGISFDVQPGEKIGIVGKTGSGKSSLALSMFRFMEPSEGTILIDGVDITQLSLYDLRSRLTIIPQDPVLFSGTIRSNLDPFGQHDDATLWAALKRSHLLHANNNNNNKDSDSDHSDSNDITLDSPISENGNNFSQGQRQLIALSRALVKKSSLIILDEATSSVDFDTDRRIQNTIRSEFTNSSLLTVAHRINTVIDYDRILVLDAGKIVEFDTPYRLMTKESGYFKTMCEKSGEYNDLLSIAASTQK